MKNSTPDYHVHLAALLLTVLALAGAIGYSIRATSMTMPFLMPDFSTNTPMSMPTVSSSSVSTSMPTMPEYCGDMDCNGTEDAMSCPMDCPATSTPTAPTPGEFCGDIICNNGETQMSCPVDCHPVTPAPTPPVTTTGGASSGPIVVIAQCGDGFCNGNENMMICPTDCMGGATSPGFVPPRNLPSVTLPPTATPPAIFPLVGPTMVLRRIPSFLFPLMSIMTNVPDTVPAPEDTMHTSAPEMQTAPAAPQVFFEAPFCGDNRCGPTESIFGCFRDCKGRFLRMYQ